MFIYAGRRLRNEIQRSDFCSAGCGDLITQSVRGGLYRKKEGLLDVIVTYSLNVRLKLIKTKKRYLQSRAGLL